MTTPLILDLQGRSYLRLRRLGSGAFAEVWSAINHLGIPCAVKRFSSGHSNYDTISQQAAAARTRRDTWVRETASHYIITERQPPHVVPLWDFFEREDECYTVMPLCDGSLHQLLSAGVERGEEWLLRVAADVLTGLHWIHDNGAVHHDLHPGNVLFVLPSGSPFSQPAAYNFLVSDFTLGARWFISATEEHPEMIQKDIADAAALFTAVGLGEPEARCDAIAAARLPPHLKDPIQDAFAGAFSGDEAAKQFCRALGVA